MSSLSQFFTLLRKDLLLEARAKETITVMVCLSMLLAVVGALGMSSSFLDQNAVLRVAPTLIWTAFLFSATAALGRSLEHELEFRAVDGLVTAGAAFELVYLSKLCANGFVLVVGHAAASILLLGLLDLGVPGGIPAFLAVSATVIFGYCALAVLMAGISATARVRGVLLPLILLPLLFPLILGAIELTTALFLDSVFEPLGFWFTFLLFLDVLYLVLGINLYPQVIRE